MRMGSSLQSVAQRVDLLTKSARDYLAKPSQIRIAVTDDAHQSMILNDGTGALTFRISDTTHHQLADFTGIPMPYYRRMRESAPALLAENTNVWLQREDGRRMVRTALGEDDRPQVRALLSSRFRPLDNFMLLEAILPLLSANGVKVESCELTEKRLYINSHDSTLTPLADSSGRIASRSMKLSSGRNLLDSKART